MSIFSRLRRSSTAADRYTVQAASYAASNISRKHDSYNRQQTDIRAVIPEVSFENNPYLLTEAAVRGAASEISLRSEYTILDGHTLALRT